MERGRVSVVGNCRESAKPVILMQTFKNLHGNRTGRCGLDINLFLPTFGPSYFICGILFEWKTTMGVQWCVCKDVHKVILIAKIWKLWLYFSGMWLHKIKNIYIMGYHEADKNWERSTYIYFPQRSPRTSIKREKLCGRQLMTCQYRFLSCN